MTDLSQATDVVHTFATEVGESGPVVAVGGGTKGDLGGTVHSGTREARAPAGIWDLEPAEMTVRVGAGTEVVELQAALREHAQMVALPDLAGSTVGGALAAGRSDMFRLGRGHIREAALQIRYVSADGRVVTAGGPTVKNVSGFDLCRLLVGSLGTLGLFGDMILRTRPVPATRRWSAGAADPEAVRNAIHWPVSVLWDGATTWTMLEGNRIDVDADTAVLGQLGLREVEGPPALPPHRWSLQPNALMALTGEFVAEIGVGTVHHRDPQPQRPVSPGVDLLNRRLKGLYDPTGRLAPGRSVLT